MRSAQGRPPAAGAWLLAAPLVLGYALRGTLHSLIMGLLLMTAWTVLADSEAPPHPRRVYRMH